MSDTLIELQKYKDAMTLLEKRLADLEKEFKVQDKELTGFKKFIALIKGDKTSIKLQRRINNLESDVDNLKTYLSSKIRRK